MTLEAFQHIIIDQVNYKLAEHPQAKGMPYGQEGRKAVVYQLVDGHGIPYALKVFKTRFRIPHMTLVAEKLAPYAGWPGLRACQRTVLTASRHASLISTLPELTYAELMPWIEGQTWQEILLGRKKFEPDESLTIARSFASVLVRMEEQGLAHCDLSAPNLILTPDKQVELVDLEEMYLPGFQRPGAMPSGSPGYGHRTAASGLWGSTADRFSGALLLAEMLGWADERVVQDSWAESFFSPEEIQQNCSRFRLLTDVLAQRCGKRIADLFTRAWKSDTLEDCPTLAEWMVAIPEQMSELQTSGKPTEAADIPESARKLLDLAHKLEGQGDFNGARLIFEQVLNQIPEGSEAARNIQEAIRNSFTDSNSSHDEIATMFDQALKAVQSNNWPVAQELLQAVVRQNPEFQKEGQSAAQLLLTAKTRLVDENNRISSRINGRFVWIWAVPVILLFVAGLYFLLPRFIINPEPTSFPSPMPSSVPSLEPSLEPSSTSDASMPFPPTCTAIGQTWISPKDGMTLVCVPSGQFLMGAAVDDKNSSSDEQPQHQVSLKAFWIDKTEVTNAMYRKCFQDGVCQVPNSSKIGNLTDYFFNVEYDHYPVAFVGWNYANLYCIWAGRRLPSEAQWEKAARGTDGRLYPWGNTMPDSYLLNYNLIEGQTTIVGKYPQGASPYGALDMAGNVWEWVADWYGGSYYNSSPSSEPNGPYDGSDHVLRGGAWDSPSKLVRSSYRNIKPNATPSLVTDGFRCSR